MPPRPLLIALVMLVAVTGGCGSGSSRSSQSAVSKTTTVKPWCRAQPNAAWKRALTSGLVALSRHASVHPLAVASDGRSFYALLVSKGYSGIVKVDASTSRYEKISRVPTSDTEVVEGNTDGRWLVWVTQSGSEFKPPYQPKWELWSWDSQSGRLRQIGASPPPQPPGPSGKTDPPIYASTPSVRGGYAVWTPIDELKPSGIRVVDLASGRTRILDLESVAPPLLLSNHVLVWSRLSWPKTVRLAAVNALTGKRVALPPALRNPRGIQASTLSNDGSESAYVDGPSNSLWFSPSSASRRRQVFATRRKEWIEGQLELSQRYLSFGTNKSLYLANTTIGRYLRISPGGTALLNEKALVVIRPSTKKAIHAIADVVFLPLGSLPAIPACS